MISITNALGIGRFKGIMYFGNRFLVDMLHSNSLAIPLQSNFKRRVYPHNNDWDILLASNHIHFPPHATQVHYIIDQNKSRESV